MTTPLAEDIVPETSPDNGSLQPLAVLAVFGSIVCFAAVPSFLRYILKSTDKGGLGLDPWSINAVRYSVSALFWSPIIAYSAWKARQAELNPALARPVNGYKPGVWRASLIPLIANVAGQVCLGALPAYLDASIIGFGVKSSFLFTVVFGFFFFRDERLLGKSGAFWAGVALSVAGLVALSWSNLAQGGQSSLTGWLLLLQTSAGWGLYGVLVKKYLKDYASWLGFGVISIGTTLLLIIAALIFGNPASLNGIGLSNWALILVSGLIGTTFSHVMLYYGIKRIGAVVSSGISLGSPILALAIARLSLGETMTVSQVIGGAIILAGGALLILARSKMGRLS